MAPRADGRTSADYQFVTRWRVPGTCGEVADVLDDPLSLPRWWPSVYLAVDELEPAGPDGLGRRIALHTRGFLPYTLRWEFRVVERRYPHALTLAASGDFDGCGAWTFVQDGPVVDVTFDWSIRADKPWLRRLSFLFRPLFEANHRWAMARGEESLTLELARRRAASAEARAAVPPPPGPVTYAGVALTAGVVGIGIGAAWLIARTSRRR